MAKVKLNQKVSRYPISFSPANGSPLTGKVIYIHPGNQYHVVQFEVGGGMIREAFKGVAVEPEKRGEDE